MQPAGKELLNLLPRIRGRFGIVLQYVSEIRPRRLVDVENVNRVRIDLELDWRPALARVRREPLAGSAPASNRPSRR